ncbi:alpha/beta hydrolase family protein [Pseudooceanicola sediminis]|nr:alpha/beta fold hydrolase [Pseudooceanicola sediminis]
MRPLSLLMILLFASTGAQAQTAAPVGHDRLDIPGIEARVLYPTTRPGPVTMIADNPAFVGVPVVDQAPLADGLHPVALLSHGYSGLWRNQAWLAGRMAAAGYVVVTLNHPGTTFGDMSPDWAQHSADRVHQLSRALDALLDTPRFAASLDRDRIAVIGHSLGGSTALMMAGGTFSFDRLMTACGDATDALVCSLYRKSGSGQAVAPAMARDPRIRAAVLLDMEGIRAFPPESLAGISIPVLALAAGIEDPALPLGWESREQAARLPAATSRYAEIIGATHFTFISECKPGAEELLEEDAYICRGETAPRAVLHDEIAKTVIRFLTAGTQMVSALQQP